MMGVVSPDGSGDFLTLQSAVDAGVDEIHVRAGVYCERVVVHRSGVRITGEDGAVLTFSNHATQPRPDGTPRGTFLSATLIVLGDDVTVENLTVRNDAGDGRVVGQAPAVYAAGDRGMWKNCRLIACQDTLFCAPVTKDVLDDVAPYTCPTVEVAPAVNEAPVTKGRQYFEGCFIQGDVDFIFGSYRCWFEDCTLFMNARGGWYTAANTAREQPWGFVFHKCRLTGECAPGAAYLGRPWRAWARTLFLACNMDACVNPQGFADWENWDGLRPVTDRCGEWATTGLRADLSARHPGQRLLTDGEAAEITLEAVMGEAPEQWSV